MPSHLFLLHLFHRYRALTSRLGRVDGEETEDSVLEASGSLHGWLAWIPARLTAFGFGLAGSFDGATSAWRTPSENQGLSHREQNEQLLARIGTAALALHQLSDVLPSKVHLTVPSAWNSRRLRVPSGVALHFSDLTDKDCTWAGAVRVTSAWRTVIDCAAVQVPPELMRQAIDEGVGQGLFTATMIEPAVDYIRSFEKGG